MSLLCFLGQQLESFLFGHAKMSGISQFLHECMKDSRTSACSVFAVIV